MEAKQVDKVRSFFSEKRRSRRAAIQQAAAGLGAAGLAAAGLNGAAAQESTPEADAYDPSTRSDMLFVQSYQRGSIVPRGNEEGAYTVTLEQGVRDTIYFTDRPDRIVGATPTAQFIRGFSFRPESPPNAALVIAGDDGVSDIAVVELTNPHFDHESATATYDLKLLESFGAAGDAPLAEIAANFGVAHLFIDDCDNGDINCVDNTNGGEMPILFNQPFCYQWGQCQPCEPYNHSPASPCMTWYYWQPKCVAVIGACPSGDCRPYWNVFLSSDDLGCP